MKLIFAELGELGEWDQGNWCHKMICITKSYPQTQDMKYHKATSFCVYCLFILTFTSP